MAIFTFISRDAVCCPRWEAGDRIPLCRYGGMVSLHWHECQLL